MHKSNSPLATANGLFLSLLLALFSLFPASACSSGSNSTDEKVQQFYEIVCDSQERLDRCADNIYEYWYDAIYNDLYYGNINLAIAYANESNEEDLSIIESSDITITSLYKDIKDCDLSTLVREVLTAYSNYYEFVVNVSGSFSNYSSNKETKKKALASAIKNLSYEL